MSVSFEMQENNSNASNVSRFISMQENFNHFTAALMKTRSNEKMRENNSSSSNAEMPELVPPSTIALGV